MLKISPSKRLWAAGVKTMSKLSPQLTGPNPMDTLTLSVEFFFLCFTKQALDFKSYLDCSVISMPFFFEFPASVDPK